jgi:hypothetical protein
VQTAVVEGIAERAHHVFLAHHFGEIARAPFAGKNLV